MNAFRSISGSRCHIENVTGDFTGTGGCFVDRTADFTSRHGLFFHSRCNRVLDVINLGDNGADFADRFHGSAATASQGGGSSGPVGGPIWRVWCLNINENQCFCLSRNCSWDPQIQKSVLVLQQHARVDPA